VYTTVNKPLMPGIKDLIGKNIKEILFPGDFVSWWGAATKVFDTSTPQFVSYSLIATDYYFIALLDRFTDQLIIVYEIIEKSIKSRKFLKKILLEAARLLKTK